MARGDGTGPMGKGPKTGRAAGYCAGSATPGFMSAPGGRGFGGGRVGQGGAGRCRRGGRNQYQAAESPGRQRARAGASAVESGQADSAAQVDPDASPEVGKEQDLAALKQYAETMEQQVKQLQQQIQQLETRD